jgi:hypothetical protein
VINHDGGIEGFNTQVAYYLEGKLVVIVLGNLNGGAPAEIASKLAAVAFGEKVVLPSERKEITVEPKILLEYAGTYVMSPAFQIVLSVEGGQLMLQATGQSKVQAFAESDSKFFLKVVDAEVEFVRNDKDEVEYLILHQGGQDQKAVRKPQPAAK